MCGQGQEMGELDEQRIAIAGRRDDARGACVPEGNFIRDMRQDGGQNGNGDVGTGLAKGAEEGDGIGVREDVCAKHCVRLPSWDTEQGSGARVLDRNRVAEVFHGLSETIGFTGVSDDQQDVHAWIKKEWDKKSTEMDSLNR